MKPPLPLVTFAPHSAIGGFVFNPPSAFGKQGTLFIAEFGSEAPLTTGGKPSAYVGHRVSQLNLQTGTVRPFLINSSGRAASETGGGGLERPIDVKFGRDGAMYMIDMGILQVGKGFVAESGVMWRVVPTSKVKE
jgi:glucose/arabinose dehydrogenase